MSIHHKPSPEGAAAQIVYHKVADGLAVCVAAGARLLPAGFMRLSLIFFLCLLAAPSGTIRAQNDPAAPARPSSNPTVDEDITYFNGGLKVSIPLMQISGRGNARGTVGVVIQPEVISGSGRYTWNLPLPDLYRGPWSPFKEYYNKNLIRFGAGYGPGVLYATYRSFSDPPNWNGRRPSHLTFIDSSGTRHTLRDQQIIRQVVLSRPWPNTNSTDKVEDFASHYTYRAAGQSGKVYRSVDDLGMFFIADSFVSVPADNPWREHATDLVDYPILPSGYLYTRDGTTLRIDGGYVSWLSDRNGNTLKYVYEPIPFSAGQARLRRVTKITDSLNREVVIRYGNQSTPDTITYQAVNNSPRTIKVQRTPLSGALAEGEQIKSLPDLYPESSWWLQQSLGSVSYAPEVVASIEFPDNRSYTFRYNKYGELAKVTQPNGGITRYSYAPGKSGTGGAVFFNHSTQVPGFPDATTWVEGLAHYWLFYRRVVEVKTYREDGQTLEKRTTISRPEIPGADGCPGCVQVDTFDKDSNLVARQKHYYRDAYVHQYLRSEVRLVNDIVLWSAGLEHKLETFDVKNNVATLWMTVENTWTHGPLDPQNPGAEYSWWDRNPDSLRLVDRPRVTEIRTTLNDTNLVSKKTFKYDEFLNRTDIHEYANGAGQPGLLLRRTHTDYLKLNPVNNIDYTGLSYTPDGAHMLSLPTRQLIYQGESATPIARMDYEYDNYTPDAGQRHEALKPRANISGLCITLNATGCSKLSDPSYVVRGNATNLTTYINGGAATGPVTTYTRFDVAGNVVSTMDALGRVSRTEFDDAFADSVSRDFATFAFPTRSLSPVPDTSGQRGSSTELVTSTSYDFSSGLMMARTDANDQTTIYSYTGPDNVVDPHNRLRKVTRPDRSWTTYEYGDSPGNLYVRTQTLQQTSPAQQVVDAYDYLDCFGRSVRTYTSDGANADRAWIVKDIQYDALGRVRRSSYPYFANAPGGAVNPSGIWITTDYDGLGRVLAVVAPQPDNARTINAYKGNKVMVTDQAGRSRRSETDALGRLVQVVEFTRAVANPNVVEETVGGGDYVTTYEYDALDNLRTVTQGAQTRSYTYDSLKRLTASTTPEVGRNGNGTVNYEYDLNGNLKKRIDARGIQTDYEYDALNRIIRRKYSVGGTPPPNFADTPQADYFYDGTGMPPNVTAPSFARGMLTATKTAVSESILTGFDVMGRVTANRQVVDPQSTEPKSYLMEYTYNAAGSLTTETYPSRKVVRVSYDTAGRIAGVRREGANFYAGAEATDANRMQYAAHGTIDRLRFGNGLWQTVNFNTRLQPKDINLGTTPGSIDRLKLSYNFGTTQDNGNLLGQTIDVPNVNGVAGFTATQSYSYDFLNRLESMTEAGGVSQTYAFDQYGNRALTAGFVGDPALTPRQLSDFNPGTNRLTGREYDDAGNVTRDAVGAGRSYQYDAENRMASINGGFTNASGASYYYDGDGRRIKKATPSATTVFVYDAMGKLVAEYDSAPPAGAGGTNYLLTDVLGSTRVVTNGQGQVFARHDFLPYGEEIGAGPAGRRTTDQKYIGAGDNTRQQFTGFERDAESGLDFAQARYFASTQGRFMSVDPMAASGQAANPQTWNRYSYSLNNPLKYIDPTGQFSILDFFRNNSNEGQNTRDEKSWQDKILEYVGIIFATQTTFQQWQPFWGPQPEELNVGPLPEKNKLAVGHFTAIVVASETNSTMIQLLDPTGASGMFDSGRKGDWLGFGLSAVGVFSSFDDALKIGKTAATRGADGKFYSVAFEMNLKLKDYGRYRDLHFRRANAALDDALNASPAFRSQMEEMIPGVSEAVSKKGGRETPAGWVWHHAKEPGVMQLVPKEQHGNATSIFWNTMHPEGRGGYSRWAIPAGAPPNR